MLGLPKSIEVKKQLPKSSIYSKFMMSASTREKFDEDIKRIDIIGEVSPMTMAIEKGERIKEFFILQVSLKKTNFHENNILTICKLIKQHMILVLEYEGKVRLAVYCGKLIITQWKPMSQWNIKLSGINMDSFWENIVIQIGNIELELGNSLEEQIQINEKRRKLQKKIQSLENKARVEMQPKKKLELVQRIKELKREQWGKNNGQA